jgi:predicted alpha-1,6-mannanase (GH76 family)
MLFDPNRVSQYIKELEPDMARLERIKNRVTTINPSNEGGGTMENHRYIKNYYDDSVWLLNQLDHSLKKAKINDEVYKLVHDAASTEESIAAIKKIRELFKNGPLS